MSQPTKPRTISELAERLGVSSMTVHRAIAGKPEIAPGTRDRILAEIEELGWHPNMAARGLRQRKTYTLGILVPNTIASFLPDVLQGVDQAAESLGYHTFVSVHGHDPARAERHLRNLWSKGVDGLVHYPTESGEEIALLNEISRDIPVVVVMRYAPAFEGATLLVCDVTGGRIAGDYLLRLGHRRIGFLGYGANPFSRLRWHGWAAAMTEAGAEIDPDIVEDRLEVGAGAAVAAREAALRILDRDQRPTALFCASDRLAAGAMQAAGILGIQVPRDLSVVGGNDDPFAPLLGVPLTTIAQPKVEIGTRAAELVVHPPEKPVREKIVVAPWLVERESCAAPLASGAVTPIVR